MCWYSLTHCLTHFHFLGKRLQEDCCFSGFFFIFFLFFSFFFSSPPAPFNFLVSSEDHCIGESASSTKQKGNQQSDLPLLDLWNGKAIYVLEQIMLLIKVIFFILILLQWDLIWELLNPTACMWNSVPKNFMFKYVSTIFKVNGIAYICSAGSSNLVSCRSDPIFFTVTSPKIFKCLIHV